MKELLNEGFADEAMNRARMELKCINDAVSNGKVDPKELMNLIIPIVAKAFVLDQVDELLSSEFASETEKHATVFATMFGNHVIEEMKDRMSHIKEYYGTSHIEIEE